MRNHRGGKRAGTRVAAAAGSLALRLWAIAAHRPVDFFAIIGAAAAAAVIVVNAVFLQSGSHPAPFFANPTPQMTTGEIRPKAAEQVAPRPAEVAPPARAAVTRTPQAVAVRRNDPIADLIGQSSRVTAVQRVLSAYGYGQIKPSGFVDEATSTAIEKFEREHKLPVTGRVSDRLFSDLAAMTGHPLE